MVLYLLMFFTTFFLQGRNHQSINHPSVVRQARVNKCRCHRWIRRRRVVVVAFPSVLPTPRDLRRVRLPRTRRRGRQRRRLRLPCSSPPTRHPTTPPTSSQDQSQHHFEPSPTDNMLFQTHYLQFYPRRVCTQELIQNTLDRLAS
jgi:hypothetical protein